MYYIATANCTIIVCILYVYLCYITELTLNTSSQTTKESDTVQNATPKSSSLKLRIQFD